MSVGEEVGAKITAFRKARHLTLEALAKKVCKSKSTLSKYEKGNIVLDLESLYEIAKALHVRVDQLLCPQPELLQDEEKRGDIPAFFKGLSRFYGYVYDGRAGRLIRCVFDGIIPVTQNRFKVMMYMNFRDFARYQDCENSYEGFMEHYDALTHITLTNQETAMEQASLQVLASYLDSHVKWGLFNGFSSRPMMPIAVKMLLSKQPLKEDENLEKALKVSREDIRLLKLYNMFSVT